MAQTSLFLNIYRIFQKCVLTSKSDSGYQYKEKICPKMLRYPFVGHFVFKKKNNNNNFRLTKTHGTELKQEVFLKPVYSF